MRHLNRFVLPLAGFLVVAAIFAVALKRTPAGGERVIASALIGKPAPDFSLPDVLNPAERVTLSQFKGDWTLVNVWGTWCVECRAEHAVLLDIQRAGRVKLVGIDYKEEDPEAPLQWLQRLGNPYHAVGADVEGRAAIDFGVYGAPESFLVNRAGVIVRKQVGALTSDGWKRDFLPLIEAAP